MASKPARSWLYNRATSHQAIEEKHSYNEPAIKLLLPRFKYFIYVNGQTISCGSIFVTRRSKLLWAGVST